MLPQATVEELRLVLCSSARKLFPQFNQAWNPFGQTQDWFPFESFSDKEKQKKKKKSAQAGTPRRRQNTWQKWDFYSSFLAVLSDKVEPWLNGQNSRLVAMH